MLYNQSIITIEVIKTCFTCLYLSNGVSISALIFHLNYKEIEGERDALLSITTDFAITIYYCVLNGHKTPI